MKRSAMSSIGARREPLSRGEKLLFWMLPFGLLGFALSGFWLSRAETVPQIVFPIAAPLPSPNGFDIYVAASRTIVAAKPSVDAIDDPKMLLSTNPKLAAQNYSLARRLAWLRSNRAGFALFKTALKTPSRFPSATGSRSYAPLRQLAREKVIEANTAVLQGRWNDATIASLDTIQMGDDISRGGPLLAKLVGTAIGAIGRMPLLDDKMVPEKLTAPQASSAARRLEALSKTRPNYHDALVLEKWVSLADFLNAVKSSNWRSSAASMGGPPMEWRARLSLQFLQPETVVKRISDNFDQSVRDIDKPYNIVLVPRQALDPISELYSSGSADHYRFNMGREKVQNDVLMLRFALRAFRLENGRFPAKLGELAPRYLNKIPTDYFASGAPYGYKLSGKTYVLWSVGPDKIDNGGTPFVGRSGSYVSSRGQFPSLTEDSQGDYVAGKSR